MRQAPRAITVLAVVTIIALWGGAVLAGHDPNEPNSIHACVKNSNTRIRLVDEPADCKRDETAVEWNIEGPQGDQGDSAFQVAVDDGFTGTEQEWLASLKGDQGVQGVQGPEGPAGPAGSAKAYASVNGSGQLVNAGRKNITSANVRLRCCATSHTGSQIGLAGQICFFDLPFTAEAVTATVLIPPDVPGNVNEIAARRNASVVSSDGAEIAGCPENTQFVVQIWDPALDQFAGGSNVTVVVN